ncbi:MAG: hypothetical protein NWT08_11040 [Akkermansiaceae bacterium]|jgi:hypothetical protein|nr:hypothetical protein [Akkermansiaceae bacterium]MDP4645993.1 hypothetical protein [Akkermansiaceae bacterium]MDP4721861.1 hypothetical protein [Akkermansiaceae bacterium]MDP4781203.1 hypothetical protein [Akkermansiaceae bacterium]MDP4848568.1 hypothetical protein [Akkermansiaceae bacterium]
MKTLVFAAVLATAFTQLHAQELSDADRETLLDRLEKIQESVNSTADSRYRNAISAYRAAMLSDDAAIDFYLKCEEKVNFEDLKKDGGDFRDWKRKNDNKLSDKEFKLALRQQLRWLVLTLEAASEDVDREALASKAADAIDSIISQAEDLKKHREVLNGSVTGTVFAKAYDLNTVKVENWPLSPIPVQAVYEQVIFPPLRRVDRTESLRTAWTKRITQEMVLLDLWSGKGDEKLKAGEHSPQYEKFVADSLPKIQWESEVDIFKAGDERGSAVRMLAHIEKYILHESAPKWAEEFVALLQSDNGLEEDLKNAP